MTSKWKGYYIYGNGFALPYFGEKVGMEFTLTINEDQFSGQCTETNSEFAQDQESNIEGYIEGNFVSFTKTFPSWLSFQNSEEIGNKPQELIYEGIINNEGNIMYGTWVLPSFAQIELVERELSLEGLWMLKKEG